MPHLSDNPLGKHSEYPKQYAPELLFAVPRSINRKQLGIGDELPFHGFDLWHAYEVSWLDQRGKPVVALGRILVPGNSPHLVESKSLKLYLNSLNQMNAENSAAVQSLITNDLAAVLGAMPVVELFTGPQQARGFDLCLPSGIVLDELQVETDIFEPDASLLQCSGESISETLHSDLFKSNCPVTGQPDWGSVVIRYSGPRLDHHALLRYLISYRNHQGFHEHCAEMIFRDLQQHCAPEFLTVAIHFVRRGGLDINPIRSTHPVDPSADFPRFARQ